jgi:hypothetical protein
VPLLAAIPAAYGMSKIFEEGVCGDTDAGGAQSKKTFPLPVSSQAAIPRERQASGKAFVSSQMPKVLKTKKPH